MALALISVLVVLGNRPGEAEAGPSAASTASDPDANRPRNLGRCTIVTYTPPTAAHRREGELCRPDGATNDVAVVLVHAGGGFLGNRSLTDAWRDIYVTAGYTTFAIDYRLLTNGDHRVYPEPEQNVKAAVQYLRSHDGGDADRKVVVHGGSAGARLGGILLTTPDDPAFAGPNLWPGLSDAVDAFVGLYGYYDGFQFDPAAYYGGAPDRSAVSTDRAAFASGPAFLAHGEADGVIPASQSVAFADALRRAGRSVRYDAVAGGAHGFDVAGGDTLTEAGRFQAAEIIAWLAANIVP